jgi:hypothetical protein
MTTTHRGTYQTQIRNSGKSNGKLPLKLLTQQHSSPISVHCFMLVSWWFKDSAQWWLQVVTTNLNDSSLMEMSGLTMSTMILTSSVFRYRGMGLRLYSGPVTLWGPCYCQAAQTWLYTSLNFTVIIYFISIDFNNEWTSQSFSQLKYTIYH